MNFFRDRKTSFLTAVRNILIAAAVVNLILLSVFKISEKKFGSVLQEKIVKLDDIQSDSRLQKVFEAKARCRDLERVRDRAEEILDKEEISAYRKFSEVIDMCPEAVFIEKAVLRNGKKEFFIISDDEPFSEFTSDLSKKFKIRIKDSEDTDKGNILNIVVEEKTD